MSDQYNQYNQEMYRPSGPPRNSIPQNTPEVPHQYSGGSGMSYHSNYQQSSRSTDYSQQGANQKTRVSRFDNSYKNDEKSFGEYYNQKVPQNNYEEPQLYPPSKTDSSKFRSRSGDRYDRDDRSSNKKDGYSDRYKHEDDPRSQSRYSRESRGYSGSASAYTDFNQGDLQDKNQTVVMDDTIFVSNLPKYIKEDDLAKLFGEIGVIKMDKKTRMPKIYVYLDSNKISKGEATVTFDDSQTVPAAIKWLNDKEMFGNKLKIEVATRKVSVNSFTRGGSGGRGRGRGRGGFGRNDDRGFGGGDFGNSSSSSGDFRRTRGGGDRGGFGQGGSDWNCDQCGNVNFARRTQCNRCQAPKMEAAGGNDGGIDSFNSSSSGIGRYGSAPYDSQDGNNRGGSGENHRGDRNHDRYGGSSYRGGGYSSRGGHGRNNRGSHEEEGGYGGNSGEYNRY